MGEHTSSCGQGAFTCQMGRFQMTSRLQLVGNSNILPLLGRKACLGMKIVSYLDNDELYKSNVGDSTVYTLSDDIPVSKEVLAKKYPKVFNMRVGKLEGEYHIRLKDESCEACTKTSSSCTESSTYST